MRGDRGAVWGSRAHNLTPSTGLNKYSVFLLTSGRAAISLPVTSYLIHPMRGIWEHFWGVSASVRGSIQHPVFSVMRADWGAVWGSRAHNLTPSTRLWRAWCPNRQIFGCSLIGRNGSREQIDGVSHANETRDPQNSSPIVFSEVWLVRTHMSHAYYWYFLLFDSGRAVYKRSTKCCGDKSITTFTDSLNFIRLLRVVIYSLNNVLIDQPLMLSSDVTTPLI